MKYEIGKIYRLGSPSDGQGEDGTIARYPVGLPVVLVERSHDMFIVREPYGKLTSFPLRMVWSMGEDVDIFEEGAKGDGELLLQPFPSEEDANRIWKLYSEPEKNRWYVDELREGMKDSIYSDWECGHSRGGIRNILKAARILMTFSNYESEHSQELTNAICDIALLVYEGDAPDWCEEISQGDNLTEVNYELGEEAAYHVVNTILQLMDHDYFVKSGGNWNLKEGKFQHRDFEEVL